MSKHFSKHMSNKLRDIIRDALISYEIQRKDIAEPETVEDLQDHLLEEAMEAVNVQLIG